MIKRRWSRFRTSTKITIAMVSVAAFAVLSTSGFFFNQMVRDLEREESASFAAMQRQVVLASEVELDRAETVAVSIAGLPGVVEAFGARDRKALSQVVDGVFPRIKQLGVSQAQFHLAPATSFFRMHKPGRYGDDLSSFRHTVVACNQAHKVVRAAEAGRFGIGFRAVVPVRKGDEYLGSFEIGADAGSSFIEGLKRATGDEWVLIPLDRSESGTTVDPGKTIATASSATEAIGDWDYFSALKEGGVSAVERRTVQGMPVALVAQPMKGFDGTVIAHLIAVRDRSASVAAMTRALWVTVLLSLVLIGVSAVLTRVLAVQISRPLQVLVHRTREMMGGMPEHSRIENGQDAVTELTLSIASMADYLKDATRNADALAVGDLGYEIQTRGNDDHLGTAFCRLQDTLRGVLVEIERLIQAAKEGELQTRSDGQDLEGGWAQVINEINDLMGVLESPVSVVSSALEAIAAKDLRARVDNEFQGRFAVMGQGVNQAAEVLDRGIQQIAQSGEQVAGAAKEIAAASNELAQGASSQAESLASTMEDLKLAVESAAQNRQHAYAAREIVDKATSSTQEGVQAMERLADSMGHISASAQDIGRIVRTIDEIAFQTNLLALNAAVEAARAGEAGKGFAVVAEEVRSLAMRSAEASRQTGEMIGTALERAEEGNSYCSEVVALFEKIRSAVSKSHSVMEEISSEADRQSESIHAVQDRIDEIGRITERSAAGAEETAASAAELASQSDSMRSLVGDFQLSK